MSNQSKRKIVINNNEVVQTIANNDNHITIESDLDGNFLYISSQIYAILGYKPKEITRKNCVKLIHPEDQSNFVAQMKSLIKCGGPILAEYRVLHKEGHYIHLSVNGMVIKERKTLKLIALFRDISIQKKNEKKYRLMLENANDLIKVLNSKFEYEELNGDVHKRVLGYSKEELLYTTPAALVHPEDRKRSAILLSRILRKGKGSFQARFKHKNGTIKWLEISAKKFVDSAGNQKIITVGRDITERKLAELKLETKNNELKQLNDLKTEFLRRASHELKTPLVSIRGNAEIALMLHHKSLKPEVISMLEAIQESSERLKNIINKLIESSKLESSNIEFNINEVDLSSLIKVCIKEVQILAKMKNLTINLDLKNSITTKLNKDQILEVISNLLSNAINYSPPGGIIEIASNIEGSNIIFSIKDTGIGFTEEEKLNIFQKFGKFNRMEQGFDVLIEGSGLGLYIAKKIIKLHGGEIWVESEGRNKGSIFYFTLPLI
ncbi:MAG: PAS domain S-box protein [Candidatus Hermodarchaeota archaeon]